jgi:hypothetical protein
VVVTTGSVEEIGSAEIVVAVVSPNDGVETRAATNEVETCWTGVEDEVGTTTAAAMLIVGSTTTWLLVVGSATTWLLVVGSATAWFVARVGSVEVVEETAAIALPLTAATAGKLESSALTQPVFAVRAAGQATCSKDTVGLSAPSNQPNRQSQPAWSASGRLAQSEAAVTPPYCAPQPELGAPHSVLQPLKIPTPPPGI